jgi:histidine ammonia-lyase
MAVHGSRRLLAMAGNAAHVVAIEALAAAQAIEFHAPLRSSAALENVRARLRREAPRLDNDRYLHPDIAAAAALVASNELVASAGDIHWPELDAA